MKTKSIFMAMLAVVIGLTAVATDAAVRKGPYMIYEGTNTEMTVLWQLDSTQTCTIEWGETTSYGSSDTSSEYGGDHQHAYTITGLTPGVKYYYQVVDVGSGSLASVAGRLLQRLQTTRPMSNFSRMGIRERIRPIMTRFVPR